MSLDGRQNLKALPWEYIETKRIFEKEIGKITLLKALFLYLTVFERLNVYAKCFNKSRTSVKEFL